MGKIIIQTDNPLDLVPEELGPLAEEIRPLHPDHTVEVVGRDVPRGTYGVTPYEVITVWVPTAVGYFELLKVALRWARKRFEGSPGRPKSVTIYGADGNPIKSVVLRSPDAEPEEQELDRTRFRLPPGQVPTEQ